MCIRESIGAYKPEGYEWCDELCETVTGNIDYACDYIAKHFEGVEVSKPQGTYMPVSYTHLPDNKNGCCP